MRPSGPNGADGARLFGEAGSNRMEIADQARSGKKK